MQEKHGEKDLKKVPCETLFGTLPLHILFVTRFQLERLKNPKGESVPLGNTKITLKVLSTFRVIVIFIFQNIYYFLYLNDQKY